MGTVILILAAIFIVIVVPLLALTKAAQANREAERLGERTRILEWKLQTLQDRVENDLAGRIPGVPGSEKPSVKTGVVPESSPTEQLRTALAAARAHATSPAAASSAPEVVGPMPTTAPPPIPPILPPPSRPTAAAAPPAHAEGSSSGAAAPRPERPSLLENFNWEQFMGVRLFAWLGGFALFLAAAFFLKYSFDHGWIQPWLRVTMGFVTGMGLILGGLRLSQKRYKITADTLCATGVVILYVVTFACRSIYHFEFFGVIPTFLLMVLITATAFLLAVRLKALVVAVLGMLGGFLTPVLVNTGQDNPGGLFTYIALLDLGLIAVAHVRRWNWLTLAAAIGTVATQFGWASKFYLPEKVFIAMAIFLGFCALFTAASAWAKRQSASNPWLLAGNLLLPAATFLFSLGLVSNEVTGYRPGVLFAYWLGADLALIALSLLHLRELVLGEISPNPDSRFEPPNRGSPLFGVPALAGPAGKVGGSRDRLKPGLPTAFHREAVEGGEDRSITLPSLRWLNQLAGGIVFLLLAIWTGARVNDALLFWALGGCFGFAVLHTALPIVLQRRYPDESVPVWTQAFPVLALLVALVPILRFEDISFLVWPIILLIDLLAIAVAVVTASIGGILVVLLVTAAIALAWILRIPAELSGLPEMLVVLGALAAVFTIAGVFAGKKILARQESIGGKADAGILPPGWLPADVQQQIPALAGVLPFLLLVLVTARLPLANPSPVFGLALLLVGLLLGLARLANMTWLPAVGLGCSFLVEYAWHFRHFNVEGAPLALAWYLVFYATFSLYPFVCHRGDGSKVIAWIASAFAGPVHFWLIYELTKRAWPNEVMGMIPAVFALPAIGGLILALRQIPADHPSRNTILAWFGGVALFFITLIFPIQFDRQWLTIAWALEGAALLWLFHRIPHRGLPVVGVGLLIVAFARLALNPAVFEYHARSTTAIFNWYLYSYGLVIAACFAGAKLMAPPREKVLDRDARPLLVTLGTVLAFILLNIEIADYFTPEGQRVLTFSFQGNFARDMSYTIGWALFAFVLLVVGILRRIRPSRWAGIGLLAVTLLKLFFHDLAALNQLYRVGALVGVAIVAIVASFLYQKFLAEGVVAQGEAVPPESESTETP